MITLSFIVAAVATVDPLSRDLTLVASSLGTVISLGLIIGYAMKRIREDVMSKLGDPDGRGNISSMMVEMLNGQTGQDDKIGKLEGGQADHGQRLGALEQDMVGVKGEIKTNTARFEGFTSGRAFEVGSQRDRDTHNSHRESGDTND